MGTLREWIADDGLAVLPGVWDAASANAAHTAGAGAVLLAGTTLADALFASENEGLVSPSELATTVRHLKERPEAAVLVDAQSGFGNQLTAHFAVRDLVAAGADGVMLNDQAFPSRSEAERVQAASLPELLARLRAAHEATAPAGVALVAKLDGLAGAYDADELAKRVIAIAEQGLADAVVARVNDPEQAGAAAALARTCAVPFGLEVRGFAPRLDHMMAAGCRVALLPDALREQAKRAMREGLAQLLEGSDTDVHADAGSAKTAISSASAAPASPTATTVAPASRFPSDADKPTRIRRAFRNLCFRDKRVSMVVAPDALTARIAESVGFKAIFSAGYGTSAARLAKPDRGIADFGLMADNAREVINAVNIPVFVDGDTGYGDVDNIARMVRVYENLGAAGLFIEDQVWPKRCGHMDGKAVVSREEGIARIAAAAAARRHPDFLIMSRTDVYATAGLDEALERTRAYHAAGADLCFIEAPQTRADMERIPQLFTDAPLMANMIESGKTPLMTDEEIFGAGYTIAVHPCGVVYTEAYAAHRLLDDMQRFGGDIKGDLDQMIAFPKFNEFLGLDQINELEQRFAHEG